MMKYLRIQQKYVLGSVTDFQRENCWLARQCASVLYQVHLPYISKCNLWEVRKKYFSVHSVKELFENVVNCTIIDISKETHFYHQLCCLLLQFCISSTACTSFLLFVSYYLILLAVHGT